MKTGHIDESQLHDFLEGALDPEAETAVQEHLNSCSECMAEMEGLTELLQDLRELPLEAQPARDLWPQIAWRMGGVETPAAARGDRRFSLSGWQLLAASIAIMVISGGSVWAVLSGRVNQGVDQAAVTQTPAQFVSWEESYGGYDEAVVDLEAFLEKGREVLDPETVEVLEENLRVIDDAIEEAREALARDPASSVLQRFLAENLRKKVDMLRHVVGAVYAIT